MWSQSIAGLNWPLCSVGSKISGDRGRDRPRQHERDAAYQSPDPLFGDQFAVERRPYRNIFVDRENQQEWKRRASVSQNQRINQRGDVLPTDPQTCMIELGKRKLGLGS